MSRESAGTVLVVDDELTYRTRIADALRATGLNVLETNGISKALTIDEDERDLDFLVTDVALPDGNGCSLAIALRKRRPDLRVLFVSFEVGLEACQYHG